MQLTCVGEERLTCSNNACKTRICRKCQFPASPQSIHRWEKIQAQLVMKIWILNLITDLMMIDGMMMDEVMMTRFLPTILVNITSVKILMMPMKIIGMMI
jgi:hypothetical protein